MHGVAGNVIIGYDGRFQGKPLHTACGYGHIEIVKCLVEWDEKNVTLEASSKPVKLPSFTNTSEKSKELSQKVNFAYFIA